MRLSIIIPTFNEENFIFLLLSHIEKTLSGNYNCEIIIADGNSTDKTLTRVKEFKSNSSLLIKSYNCPAKGRAFQMNFGAKKAKGEYLYFLHADTFPPTNFDETILNFVTTKTKAGSFRMKFDKNTPFFNFWSWFTRFKWNIASGGDQSLFVSNVLFIQITGFNEDWVVMEDVNIILRLKRITNYKIIAQNVITSSRRHDKFGKYRLQSIFVMMQIQRIMKRHPKKINAYYKRKLNSFRYIQNK